MRLLTSLVVDLSDAARYLERDWGAVTALKEQYWVERVRRLGSGEGLRVADELRRQVVALRPGWPSPEDRRKDFEDHERLAELLRRAVPARGR